MRSSAYRLTVDYQDLVDSRDGAVEEAIGGWAACRAWPGARLTRTDDWANRRIHWSVSFDSSAWTGR